MTLDSGLLFWATLYIGFDLPSVIIVRQSKKFLSINVTCTVS